MAIRYNMTTGQGTYADGTPFEMGDIQHGMSKPVALGLHPEADARLAAATTGGPIRGQSVRGVWIDEAADPGEAREAIASVGPYVASMFHNEVKRLASAMGRVKSIAIVRGDGVETHLLDGTRVNAGDTVTAECDAAGKWAARVRGVAAPSYARAQAIDFTGAGARLTDGPEPRAKPAALAAGQVWALPDFRQPCVVDHPAPAWLPGGWYLDDGSCVDAAYVLAHGRYLGTREEVAARDAGPSARAMRVGAAVAEGMARGVASAPAMGLSRTPLGTMTGAPAPAGPYRSAPAREPEPFALPSGAALDGVALAHYDMTRDGGETDEAFRARIVETLNDYRDRGTRPWFQRRIARALRVSPEVIDLDESTPFVVKVRTRDNCVPMSRLAEACDAMREHMPCGVTVVASHYVSPLAALRAEIDRLVAADSGPFAHARAAALRSYGERHEGHDPSQATPYAAQRVMTALRTYEDHRGGAHSPRSDAWDAAEYDVWPPALATYERERSRSDLYARRPARR